MHIQGQTDSGTARQLLPEGPCGKSRLLTLWISFAPQKSSKSYEMSYCTFTVHATYSFGHSGVARQLLPEDTFGKS